MEELGTLVTEAQAGDKEAFGQIVTRFQDMAYGIAYAILGDPGRAQDAAQEAFIDAYLCVSKLRQPMAFPGWFRRIVIKHSDRQIRRTRLETVPLDEARLPVGSPDNLEAQLVRLQTSQAIQAAVAGLPHNQRMATILFYSRGYSLREIASILELPETTIKKSLHDSRQKLKRRMVTMLQENLNANKPSQNDHFANKVQFFLALKTGELKKIKQLLSIDPQLLYVQTEWGVASDGFYWPLGVTAMHWAACTGNRELLEFLLSQAGDVDIKTSAGRTPLHIAVIMRQIEMVKSLLAHGADQNAITPTGQTPLHFAVLRNSQELVALLMEHGARMDVPDTNDRTPLDWAIQKGLEPLIELFRGACPAYGRSEMTSPIEPGDLAGSELLGQVLNERGERVDRLPLAAQIDRWCLAGNEEKTESPVFHTGIKIIDMFTPLRRGGLNGVFTSLPGVGKFVILDQLIDSLITLYDGYAVCIGLENGFYTGENMMLVWREWGVDDRVVNVFAHSESSDDGLRRLVETGCSIAGGFRDQGREVLVVVDSRIALVPSAWQLLSSTASAGPSHAISLVFYGDHLAKAEPSPLDTLDAVITFDLARAKAQLWPAVDPLNSYSRLLDHQDLSREHFEIFTRARRALKRYAELQPSLGKGGREDIISPADRKVVIRAARLERFLTQPLPGAEPWTALPGHLVPLEETLRGCQAILNGSYDDIPEEKLYFVGALEC